VAFKERGNRRGYSLACDLFFPSIPAPNEWNRFKSNPHTTKPADKSLQPPRFGPLTTLRENDPLLPPLRENGQSRVLDKYVSQSWLTGFNGQQILWSALI